MTLPARLFLLMASVAVLALLLVPGCTRDKVTTVKDDWIISPPLTVDTNEAISVRLAVNKQVFKVGEEIMVYGVLSNGTKVATFVQTKRPYGFPTTRLTVYDHERSRWHYTPWYGLKRQPKIDASCYTAVQYGESILLLELKAKAGEIYRGQDYWQCTARLGVVPPPFKSEGKYTIRLDYSDVNPKKEGAFKGSRFAELTIEIKE